MFRTFFPSIIRSPRLYIQCQVHVIQVHWLLASTPASKQSMNLHDIYLTLYVQSWTPDDGRKGRPKHVEWDSINSKNCASSWFYDTNTLILWYNSTNYCWKRTESIRQMVELTTPHFSRPSQCTVSNIRYLCVKFTKSSKKLSFILMVECESGRLCGPPTAHCRYKDSLLLWLCPLRYNYNVQSRPVTLVT
jgi:hypothetical protein